MRKRWGGYQKFIFGHEKMLNSQLYIHVWSSGARPQSEMYIRESEHRGQLKL